MKQNWNFPGVHEVKNKQPSIGGASETLFPAMWSKQNSPLMKLMLSACDVDTTYRLPRIFWKLVDCV